MIGISLETGIRNVHFILQDLDVGDARAVVGVSPWALAFCPGSLVPMAGD